MNRKTEWNRPNRKSAKSLARRVKDWMKVMAKFNGPSPNAYHKPGSNNK